MKPLSTIAEIVDLSLARDDTSDSSKTRVRQLVNNAAYTLIKNEIREWRSILSTRKTRPRTLGLPAKANGTRQAVLIGAAVACLVYYLSRR